MPAGPARIPTARHPTRRRFAGVNLQLDPAFLGAEYLQLSQNWRPAQTYRLRKRQGTTLHFTDLLTSRVQALHVTHDAASGDQLWYQARAADGLRLRVNGITTGITNSTFATANLFPYGMAELGNFLYVGNGTDPIKQVPIDNAAVTAVDLVALATFTDSSAAPAAAADAASSMLVGSYSFVWAVYNHVTKQYIRRAQPRSVRLNGPAGGQNLTFVSPAAGDYTLQANELFHLFVAPVNLPVEFGSDQTPVGIGQAVAGTIVRDLIVDGPPTPRAGTVRTGNILRTHLGALWLAGDVNDPRAVTMSNFLVLGREQAEYDIGAFFPARARIEFPFNVTAMGVVASTLGDQPRAPMAVFGHQRVAYVYGALIDDPSISVVEVNSSAGCIAPMSLQVTDYGLVYLGRRSVYLIPAMGGPPIDVGWPIEPYLRSIPKAQRRFAVGLYHKGFYTLYSAPPGSATNIIRWDLDLRQGGQGVPSWWGPHAGIGPVSAAVTDPEDATEDDRGYAVMEVDGSTTRTMRIEQEGVRTDAAWQTGQPALPVVSTLITPDDDDGDPFLRKIYTGVRVKGRAEETASLQVNFMVDGGDPILFDPIILPGTAGDDWDAADWDIDDWAGNFSLVEGDGEAPEDRPRGMSAAVMLTTSEPKDVELRDYEAAYIPAGRNKAEDPPVGAVTGMGA